ncbi:replication termination factor 2-like [Lineus longissimus]|uniref:replication termination factor 2-like n=1 Tax=Lineus longissimus TaxID=88925 RepID=UPI002B4DD7CD
MGCDGGTIPTRDELVRLKKKPEQKDKFADLAHKWQNCAISQEPLRRPIVACELGRLYNKDVVIELLLDKSKFDCAASFDHIRGLKDVKVLQLTDNPAYKDEDHKAGYAEKALVKYICPIAGLEMNGRHRFSFLWKCGCVFSERALKEVKTETCQQCGMPCSDEDPAIILNGTEEEMETQRTAMDERRLKAKLQKKAKKGQTRKAEEALGSADGPSIKVQKMSDEPSTSKKLDNGSMKSVGTNGTASKLAKGSKLASGASVVRNSGNSKFKTVQEDPSKSKAYKSLFTSHEKARNQTKAHWVTYNPCFY